MFSVYHNCFILHLPAAFQSGQSHLKTCLEDFEEITHADGETLCMNGSKLTVNLYPAELEVVCG